MYGENMDRRNGLRGSDQRSVLEEKDPYWRYHLIRIKIRQISSVSVNIYVCTSVK